MDQSGSVEKSIPESREQSSGLRRLAKLLGPGIIAVLSWLGAGDLITS